MVPEFLVFLVFLSASICQEPGIQEDRVKFGTRLSQAKSRCIHFANCQFGINSDSEPTTGKSQPILTSISPSSRKYNSVLRVFNNTGLTVRINSRRKKVNVQQKINKPNKTSIKNKFERSRTNNRKHNKKRPPTKLTEVPTVLFNTNEDNLDTKVSINTPEKELSSNSLKDGEIKRNPVKDVDKDINKINVEVPVKNPANAITSERRNNSSSILSEIKEAINLESSTKHQDILDKTSDSEDSVQKLAQTSTPQQRGSRRRENGSRRISGFLSIRTNPLENSRTMVQTNAKKMRDPATKILDLSTSEGNLGETVTNSPNTGLEESITVKIDQQQGRKNDDEFSRKNNESRLEEETIQSTPSAPRDLDSSTLSPEISRFFSASVTIRPLQRTTATTTAATTQTVTTSTAAPAQTVTTSTAATTQTLETTTATTAQEVEATTTTRIVDLETTTLLSSFTSTTSQNRFVPLSTNRENRVMAPGSTITESSVQQILDSTAVPLKFRGKMKMNLLPTKSRGLTDGANIDENMNNIDDKASNPVGTSASNNSEETIESLKLKCNQNLESCVTSCVPLEDVYAYSLCVVECAQNCS